MTIDECRKMPKGTKVRFSLGGGWYQVAVYKGMEQVTEYGKCTLADLMNRKINLFSNGRTVWHAVVDYVNDHGKIDEITIRPSRLKKVAE